MDQIKNKVAQTLGQDPLGVSGEQGKQTIPTRPLLLHTKLLHTNTQTKLPTRKPDIDKFNTARIPGDTAGGGVGNSINPGAYLNLPRFFCTGAGSAELTSGGWIRYRQVR